MAFSPEGSFLASGSFGRTVRLFKAHQAAARPHLGGHTDSVYALAFSPDGTTIASGGVDSSVRLWEAQTGKSLRVLHPEHGTVSTLAFSPDGTRLVAGCYGDEATVWDTRTGELFSEFNRHSGSISGVDVHPDNRRVASGGYDKVVRIWDIESTQELRVLTGHTSAVMGVDISPDGRLVAGAGRDNSIRVWDFETGEELKVLQGHDGGVFGVRFDSRSERLISGGSDRTLRIWNMKDGKDTVLGNLGGRVYWPDISPDGRFVGAPASDGTVTVFSTDGRLLFRAVGHRGEVNALAYSPDGKVMATVGDDGTVRTWSSDGGQPLWQAPLLDPQGPCLWSHLGVRKPGGEQCVDNQGIPPGLAAAVPSRARHVSLSADRSYACLANSTSQLEFWDVAADKLLFQENLTGLTQVAAFAGGCVTTARSQVRLYDRNSSYTDLRSEATALTVVDGRLVIAARDKVFSYSDASTQTTLCETGPGVTAVSSTGVWAVLGFVDGNIELAPLTPGAPRPTFSFQGVVSSPVVSLLPGPMNTVMAGYANGFVGLWSLSDGTLLNQARLHGPAVYLLLKDSTACLASELGDMVTWDLGVLFMDYCDLLRQVWEEVPVVWHNGQPVVQEPGEHRCLR